MTMFNEYFTGNCSISLENVKYEKINEFEGNVTLEIKDDFKIKKNTINSSAVELIISRKLSFIPRSLVDITVSFGVGLELNEKYKGNNAPDEDTLKNELFTEDNLITSIVMSRISLLISQLTSSYGERPIVTPPSFILEE